MLIKLNQTSNFLISIVSGGVILYFGSPLFIPLSFALLISFAVFPVCKRLEEKGMPSMVAIVPCVMMVVLFFAGILALLFQQLLSFSAEWIPLRDKLMQSLTEGRSYLTDHFNITEERQEEWLKNLLIGSSGGLISFLKGLVYASGVSAILILIIPVYSVLLLYYRRILAEAMYGLFPPAQRIVVKEILEGTIRQYHNFIKGMIIVYSVVGVLNTIGLMMLGIDHAMLFGFIASILTFIPYVGIMVASLLPITISWLTYDSAWYPIGVILMFTIVQYLEANIIYPVAVGNRLHLNTLVIFMAIILGGILWGAAGMILFIPFVAILKLIADHTKGWETISKLLGEK